MRSYNLCSRLRAVNHHALTSALITILILLFAGESAILGAEGLEFGRFRFSPKLAVIERYSDNIYLEEADTTDDFYTEITPEVTLDFALAPRNYFSLRYVGNFLFYNTADNFNTENHLGELSWNVETAKGSLFTVGASQSETSIQPFSALEIAKEYTLERYFAETLLMAGQVTALGARFERLSRRFDEDVDEVDDYDRDQLDLSIAYSRSEVLPLLLEYRYVRQDNENLTLGIPPRTRSFNRDYETHTIYTGARWRPAGRIAGNFRVGYTWSDFENSAIEEFSGFAMDINVLYRITEITHLRLIGRRLIQPITRAERDTGTYFVLTSGGLEISHHKWEKITTRLNYFYHHRDFEAGISATQDRIDRQHVVGASIEYALQRWISILLGYQYRNNDSDLDTVDYEENLVQLGVQLSI